MHCITSEYFVVLINGESSPLFIPRRGLRQWCRLSPLLFLLILKGPGRDIKEATKNGSLKGVHIGTSCNIIHSVFVDGIFILCEGSRRDIKFRDIMELFYKVIGMIINLQKSTISLWGIT
jgi:hypothetical protein